jgi:hypothetical protein
MALRLHDALAMKKSTPPKLALNAQTIRRLTAETLDRIAGGNVEPVANGFIMKDTIIVRTSSR